MVGAVFVRHGASVPVAGSPTAKWPLDAAHFDEVLRLTTLVPRRSAVVSSDYRRALETAAVIGKPRRDPRLREVARPWSDNFDRDVARYLAGDSVDGWEPQRQVVDRVSAAVADFGQDAIYVGHGTAFTLYLCEVVPDIDAFEFWEGLQTPDAWHLDGTLSRCPTSH